MSLNIEVSPQFSVEGVSRLVSSRSVFRRFLPALVVFLLFFCSFLAFVFVFVCVCVCVCVKMLHCLKQTFAFGCCCRILENWMCQSFSAVHKNVASKKHETLVDFCLPCHKAKLKTMSMPKHHGDPHRGALTDP